MNLDLQGMRLLERCPFLHHLSGALAAAEGLLRIFLGIFSPILLLLEILLLEVHS